MGEGRELARAPLPGRLCQQEGHACVGAKKNSLDGMDVKLRPQGRVGLADRTRDNDPLSDDFFYNRHRPHDKRPSILINQNGMNVFQRNSQQRYAHLFWMLLPLYVCIIGYSHLFHFGIRSGTDLLILCLSLICTWFFFNEARYLWTYIVIRHISIIDRQLIITIHHGRKLTFDLAKNLTHTSTNLYGDITALWMLVPGKRISLPLRVGDFNEPRALASLLAGALRGDSRGPSVGNLLHEVSILDRAEASPLKTPINIRSFRHTARMALFFVVLALGGWILIPEFTNFARAQMSHRWAETNGQVQSMTLRDREHFVGGKYAKTSRAEVQYQYNANGVQFTNNKIGWGWDKRDLSRSEAHAFAQHYSTGKSIRVFFNQADPTQSVLKKGYFLGGRWFDSFFAGFLLIVAGFWGLRATMKTKRMALARNPKV